MDSQGELKKCCLEYFSLISALDKNQQSEVRKCSCGSSFLIAYIEDNKILIKSVNSNEAGILVKQDTNSFLNSNTLLK